MKAAITGDGQRAAGTRRFPARIIVAGW